jgi:hypothetical protein
MKAVDMHWCRTWQAQRIIQPHRDGHTAAGSHFVTARCDELTQSIDLPSQCDATSRLEMYAFGKVNFARTRATRTWVERDGAFNWVSDDLNAAKVEVAGMEITMEQRGDAFNLTVVARSTPLHTEIVSRIREAFLFATGQELLWSMVEVQTPANFVSRIRSDLRERKRAPCPINFHNGIDPSGQVWNLFERYLVYVMGLSSSNLPALSRQVLAVAWSAEGSIQAQALTLAVAVETVVKECYLDCGKPSAEMLSRVEQIIEYVKKWTGDADVLTRAIGCIGQLKHARAKDCLHRLEMTGIVSKSGVEAWTKLRNSIAHGDWKRFEDMQNLIDHINRVRVLFFQLIFGIIGYKGSQTDYGTRDYPLVPYPPTSGPVAPAVTSSV